MAARRGVNILEEGGGKEHITMKHFGGQRV